ncbi:Carbohydrate sulfotransferase 13 [Habropoda laboriosa]|uniref:Carbohydrate sulfotransferase n=1 Tax=Habropoda laboriosa TaxID=597456 RepID=A0A0L7RIF5_9HYME|nr:PREDICTED: carbohydrate sulfotransferase 11-like [Habropoda laboriosa]KOC70650.1 Carbohydrate sulfotransferase 13 [Habropoda laboriosa]
MSLKMQFVKCTLCIILYVVVCTFLLRIKQSFDITQYRDSVLFTNYNQAKQKCTVISRIVTKPINLEIKLLERDEMKGESINLEESAAVLQQISNTCVKYNLKTALIKRHFLYNFQHKSMYCWIRKVASTSFTKLFADMKNQPSTRNYYREVDSLAPRTLKELQLISNDTKIFKLLVVRHPFQRLVSSYRDRIEDKSKYTAQAWIYAEKIFRFTRPKLFHSNTSTGNFRQKVFTRDKRLKIVPTFKEFIEWLLQSSEEDDVHWARYYTHCALCNIRYNYVLKLDDYTYGQINYVFSKFRLDKSKVYFPKLEKTRGGHTNFDITCQYLANLTEDIILKLYERYKIDFEMYNYNLNQYAHCINKSV